MKKSTKITLISLTTLAILAGIGGSLMVANDFNSRFEAFVKAKRDQEAKEAEKKKQEDKMTTKEKQLAYVKEHQQEIVKLIKSQSSKVESVQIDWDETKWSDGGLTKSEYYINLYGHINDIEDSGWVVDIPLNDDNSVNMSVNMDEMYVANSIDIGGEPIE
ncbi:hypothetical protein [Streptococcus macacae]|uniref:Uncharacterized protein n=1 Tax=Streptococcus macacae NCTC 11558 TaxID=764298 RepID=G5JXV9_9STRE|nr:hypothetical protein [Streptococcus macacae]EHJ52964.1 hypothetical protein STRMA_0004 [Streptococcus macacae NCTC 11558]SUN77881.1 lipoprotein [Streptococcus macacae NCTC 11558]